jgi:NAD-dependent DNA ligase
MLEETEVLNITWNLGKTGELIPIIWVKPVEMDGRMVQKCSGHNYGYLLEKKVSVGSKIIMSLAGDIIPFLYKVTNTDNFDENKLNVPDNTYIDGDIHLMKILNETDMLRNMFVNSAGTLNIPNIGTETAKKIFEYLENTNSDSITSDFFDVEPKKLPGNILLCNFDEIFFGVGAGRIGEKAKKSFEELLKNLSLVDIIKSCNFRFCGPKVAEQCASYMLTGNADFEHLASQGYEWVLKDYSDEKNDVYNIISHLGKTLEDFKEIYTEAVNTSSNQIPVILTGEPNNYSSKGEFLKCNPQYRNTGSWKEVQIVFTNSLESNTGKMKKAREKGIKIELY